MVYRLHYSVDFLWFSKLKKIQVDQPTYIHTSLLRSNIANFFAAWTATGDVWRESGRRHNLLIAALVAYYEDKANKKVER